ncbi:MAG: PUR family DNA/RNA-binding protein [Bacteroidaceae bacterium]|nr:PUR family DNA/RNA-binding protein [Bacteroidaceae bacterium]
MVKDIYFSQPIKAGKRIYYVDVKKTRNNEYYLSITESKKIVGGDDAESQQVSFEKHKIFLYKEDFGKFVDGLSKAIQYIHTHDADKDQALPGTEESGDATEQIDSSESSESLDIKIEF